MFNFDDANRKSRETMEAMLKSYAEVANGYQSIAAEATDFSRRSFQDMASFMEQLTSVRSVEEAYQLQATYMKSSYDAFVSEATKMSDLCADLAKAACRPYDRKVAPIPSSTAIVAADAA
ncbi:hypothetical protein ABID21_001373 [Pseudorhizobium tarimense]|uniref:Phasin domain-containing protein n=1 Tax=Pseudorhizobium tarimense TaxID=1079109 RepID=A0ABV2H429_9HYPH|nr:phasin family protein [Pseudorhizobium tarimense]MCJ8518317.1 phasin family protein [Pseudorhizobium tarimense]